MFDEIGTRFFAALAKAAEMHLDAGHSCIAALRRAGEAPGPAATAAAQAALGALEPASMNAIMGEAHRLMREDPAGLLSAWKPAGPRH